MQISNIMRRIVLPIFIVLAIGTAVFIGVSGIVSFDEEEISVYTNPKVLSQNIL